MDARTASGDAPVVIRLDKACKMFQLHHSPWSRIASLLARSSGSDIIKPRSEHRAVDGVSFTVRKGETVGLLGVNGAGKSTLLQLITGTLTPTSGTVWVDGRISALLELGAGFNREWSGRRNAEFHCIMSGVPTSDIPGRIEAIAAFADIGDFFDQPTRTYSSGMFLRVAFASAISTDPDILIVDEALAVGDVKFQNKCFRRFEELQAQGCTVLFVSHAAELVTRFCTRCIVMSAGAVHFDGLPSQGVKAYQDLLYGVLPRVDGAGASPRAETTEPSGNGVLRLLSGCRIEQRNHYNSQEQRSGAGPSSISNFVLLQEDEEARGQIISGSRVTLCVEYQLAESLVQPEFGFVLRSRDNQILFGATSDQLGLAMSGSRKRGKIALSWKFDVNLIIGEYFIDLGLSEMASGQRVPHDWRRSVIHLQVSSPPTGFGLIDAKMALTEISE